jgi:2-hydroxy-3-keto-5-methylthiopentenyl-1-phosphate phosphatase
MILFSDFDGTATIEDVTTFLWDTHLPYDWRARLLPPTYAGQWSPLEMIARGYADIPLGPEALLAEIRPRVRLRPGLDRLLSLCRARGWPFVIVSHGLSFYIRDLLPSGVALVSFEGEFAGGRWQVSLPAGISLAPGQDFKTAVVSAGRARHPDAPAVYLGDGRLDLPATAACERVFAVRGSTLERLLVAQGRAVEPFDTLDEVAAAL